MARSHGLLSWASHVFHFWGLKYMAQITITIETDCDAFHPSIGHEVSRILQENDWGIQNSLHKNLDGSEFLLRDVNGNTVGRIVWSR